jgi:hypothetical protein
MSMPSRRTFLGTSLLGATGLGVAVVVVAGAAGVAAEFIRHPASRSGHRGGSGRASVTAPPSAPVLEQALAREYQLLATLARAAKTSPSLAARIAVLRADHEAHAAALTALISAAGVTPKTAPTSSPPGTAGVRPARVTDLIRWEKAAATAVGTDFRAATGTDAAVLASIYACEQTHVAWLS